MFINLHTEPSTHRNPFHLARKITRTRGTVHWNHKRQHLHQKIITLRKNSHLKNFLSRWISKKKKICTRKVVNLENPPIRRQKSLYRAMCNFLLSATSMGFYFENVLVKDPFRMVTATIHFLYCVHAKGRAITFVRASRALAHSFELHCIVIWFINT